MVISLPGNSYPNAMAFGKDGALWVTEDLVGAIARIDTAGKIKQYRIPASDPSGILQGPDGEMLFVGLETIGRIDVSGRVTGWQTGSQRSSGELGLPTAITLGPDDLVWYVNEAGPTPSISRIGMGQPPSIVASFPGMYTFPAGGITTGPDQAVWFSLINDSYGSDAIGRVGIDGQYNSWPLPPGTVPQNLVAAADGAVWFTEQFGIGRITIAGVVSHFPVAGGERPTDITSAPDKALWFTTATHVGRITTSGKLSMWTVPAAQSLHAIVADPHGGFWLADDKANVIRRFTPPQ